MQPSNRAAPVSFTVAALTLASAAIAAGPVAGQTDAVPREFVEVFLPPGPGGTIAVGEIPDELARWLGPLGDARVVGSVIRRRSVTIALAVPLSPAAAEAEWRERLIAAGWRPTTDRGPVAHGGFLQATDSWTPPLCRDDDSSMGVHARRAPGGGSYVMIGYQSGDEGARSICAGPPQYPGPVMIELPVLRAPEGTRMMGGGSGGGRDDRQASARVVGDLSAVELARHYEAQMAEQGWVRSDEGRGQGIAATVWTRTDDDGQRWDALLVVFPGTDGDLHAHISAHRITAR